MNTAPETFPFFGKAQVDEVVDDELQAPRVNSFC
jgi:hypothetical protein